MSEGRKRFGACIGSRELMRRPVFELKKYRFVKFIIMILNKVQKM